MPGAVSRQRQFCLTLVLLGGLRATRRQIESLPHKARY